MARVSLAFGLALAALHLAVLLGTRIDPPSPFDRPVALPTPARDAELRTWDASWVRRRGGILEAVLSGSPAEMGRAHAALLHAEMLENEAALWSVLQGRLPSLAARTLLLDVARLRFRGLDQQIPYGRRLELAGAAQAFGPDPFAARIATYQRFVYLNSLYDIALSFEGSPLLGCTSVAVSKSRRAQPSTLLARNFDFETHEVFDRGKAVLVFRENGLLPVLSVAWPGLLGVVSGMNSAGVGIVIHGARAGQQSRLGEPVPISVRETLSVATSTDDAVRILSDRPAMVSHMLLIADASGHLAVMERVPGAEPHLREGKESIALSNHLEGPFASSDANQRVRENTSTLPRRARADELVARLPTPVRPPDLAAVLRDRLAAGDRPLPPGDRRAIDAGIATHAVIMDLSARRIWVSEGPHLDGRFIVFDMGAMLSGPEREDSEVAKDVVAPRQP